MSWQLPTNNGYYRCDLKKRLLVCSGWIVRMKLTHSLNDLTKLLKLKLVNHLSVLENCLFHILLCLCYQQNVLNVKIQESLWWDQRKFRRKFAEWIYKNATLIASCLTRKSSNNVFSVRKQLDCVFGMHFAKKHLCKDFSSFPTQLFVSKKQFGYCWLL